MRAQIALQTFNIHSILWSIALVIICTLYLSPITTTASSIATNLTNDATRNEIETEALLNDINNTMISKESEMQSPSMDSSGDDQVDDLLAVESSQQDGQKLRLLTIGKQPPYETSTPNNISNKLTFKNSTTTTTKSPVEIIRPAPLFIRISSSAMHPPNFQPSPMNLNLHMNQRSPFHYPTATLPHVQRHYSHHNDNNNQHQTTQTSSRYFSPKDLLPQNNYVTIMPTSTYSTSGTNLLPQVASTSSVWLQPQPQPQQPPPIPFLPSHHQQQPIVVFVSASANSVANANSTSQLDQNTTTTNFSDWSSLARYLNMTNNLNQLNQHHHHQSQQLPEATNWFSTAHKSPNQDARNPRLNSSEIEYDVEDDELKSEDKNSPTSSSFPKLINHGPDVTSVEEDEFNRRINLLNRSGTYQKTNTSNMTWNQLLKQASGSNIIESIMVTNRSTVSLLCDTEDMLIRFKFRQPFRGVIATNLDRFKSCQLEGNGNHYYEMKIPLNSCGTRQEMPRLFINNLNIQFHNQSSSSSSLNIPDADMNEVKTIICSYPIRPKAAPPLDLTEGGGLPERIIEQPSGEQPPARLIYYEPVILIAGLLLLLFALLAITTGAYVVTKQLRLRRSNGRSRNSPSWSSSASFNATSPSATATARLYRLPPAQSANMSPVKTGFDQSGAALLSKNRDRMGQSQRLKAKVSHSSAPRSRATPRDVLTRRSANERRQIKTLEPNLTDRISGIVHPNTSQARSKSLPQRSPGLSNLPNESPTPAGPTNKPTRDSLASSNGKTTSDESSVTTIEIPYNIDPNTTGTDTNTNTRRIADSQQKTNSKITTQKVSSNLPEKMQSPTKPSPVPIHLKPNEVKRVEIQRQPTSVSGSMSQAHGSKLESQASPSNSQPPTSQIKRRPAFGSIRRTLTSPKEYERLESLAKLFPNKNKTTGGLNWESLNNNPQQSQWPTKYQHKVVTSMSDEDRKLIGKMFHEDEIFRSRVVDSTDREKFHRKLRDNPLYASKIRPKTWDLLEEIILDQPVDSSSSSEVGGGDSNDNGDSTPRQREIPMTISQQDRDDEEELSVLDENKPKYAKVSSSKDSTDGSGKRTKLGNQINDEDDDDESVIIKIEGNQKPLTSGELLDTRRGQPVESSTKIQIDHGQHLLKRDRSQLNEDSLESKSSDRVDSLKNEQANNNKSTKLEYLQRQRHELIEDGDEPCVRVSQFNSTRTRNEDGSGLTGTLINIDSVTDFTSSKHFSTFTRSSIEHTRFETEYRSTTKHSQQQQPQLHQVLSGENQIPYVDEQDTSYEYARDMVTQKRMSSPNSQIK